MFAAISPRGGNARKGEGYALFSARRRPNLISRTLFYSSAMSNEKMVADPRATDKWTRPHELDAN